MTLREAKQTPTEKPPPVTELEKVRKRLKRGQTLFLTAGEAKGYGYDVEEGWMLKLRGGVEKGQPSLTIVSPDKWEVIPDSDFVISPEGKQYTRDQLSELFEEQQAAVLTAPTEQPPPPPEVALPTTIVRPQIEGALKRLYPDIFRSFEQPAFGEFATEEIPMLVLEQIFSRAEREPDTLIQEIFEKGRTPDTEALLRLFNPDMNAQDMFKFFAPPDPFAPIRANISNIFPTDKVEETMKWAGENPEAFFAQIKDIGVTKDTWNLMQTITTMPEVELVKFFQQPTKPVGAEFLSGVQTVFQYLDGWWKTGLMELGFKYFDLMEWSAGNDEAWRSKAEVILNDAFKEHGWKAIFSSKVNEAWDVYFNERLVGKPALATGLKVVSEFSNPIYLLPAGKVATVLARPFQAIPILGETMQALAKGVQLSERAIAEATLLPTLGRGIKRAGEKLSSRYLIAELPKREVLREWLFKDDYFRRVAEKIPLLGKIAPAAKVSGRLPEILTTKAEAGAAVIQETAMRNAILETGQATKGQSLAYIRELGTTREIFGGRGGLVSPQLVKPKDPYLSLALGDVLQAPERYEFTHKFGYEYAKRTQKIMREIFELAQKEGVNVKEAALEPFEEYVHWVVTGVKNKEGVVVPVRQGGKSVVGALPSSMKHRRFERMLDGINQGFIYADDVEVYVGSYVDDMFKAISDHRYGEGIKDITSRLGKELGALPVAPKDRLWSVYPETARRWWLRKPTQRGAYYRTEELVFSGGGMDVPSNWFARGIEKPLDFAKARLASGRGGTPIIKVYRISDIEAKSGVSLDRLTEGLGRVTPTTEYSYTGLQGVKPIAEIRLPKGLDTQAKDILNLLPQQPSVREAIQDLVYSMSTVKQLARGQQIAGATLRAIENRNPAIAQKIKSISVFKADRATKAKLEALVWKRMQAGKSLPATLPTERAAVKDYVAGLSKEDVTKHYQRFTKLERADALGAQLRGEFDRMLPDYFKARQDFQRAMEIVRRPLQKEGEGYIRTAKGYPHPMFQNQIYPEYIADQATKLLNEEANKLLAVTADISGAFRLQQAALDISAGVIQGIVGMFSHPVKWTKAQAWALAALVEPKVFDAYLVRHAASISERNFYLGAQRPFEYFEKLGLIQKLIGKAPFGKAVLGQTYGRAEAAFSQFATVYKNEMWTAMSASWIKKGQGAELARMLDRMTGMTSFRQLGMPANARAFASGWVSFAPQYRLSVLSYFGDAFKGGMTGGQVRRDIGRMVAGATAAYYAFAKITDNPVYLNPFTDGKKFMSINVDGHWIGLGSAVISLTRASVDIAASMIGMGDNEPMDFLTWDKWKNPVLRALIGQSAVLPQMILEVSTRKDFMGYPLGDPFDDPDAWANWGKWVGEQFTPIWLQDILYDKSGVGWSTAAVLAEFIGLRTSPQTKWETLDDKLKERKVWDMLDDFTDEQRERLEVKDETVLSVLSRFQKDQMFNANQDLIEFYDDAQADALIRGSEMYQDYVRGINNAQSTMTTDLNDASTFGITKDGKDTRWLRERYNDIMAGYGLTMELLRENEDLAPLFAEFDESREKRKPDAETIDLAYWEFIEKVLSPDRRLDNGDFDFEEYQEALEVWREKWGDDVYSKVLFITENAKRAIPNYPDWAIKLWQDRRVTNEAGYWNLPSKPIHKMDEKDKADGLIPDKYITLWEQYQSITTDEERERFKEKYPDFAKDWRTELRADNPTLDATLAFWGYGGQLQSKEAYDLVSQWSEELKIPLDQIGLGLPSEHLIDSYFEHTKLVEETSGSSPEVKLFKLKHPDYLDWGVLSRGWDRLKDEVIEALEIQVDYKAEFADYKAFGNDLSESYVPDDADRRKARAAYMAEHPEFRDADRRLDVYKTGVLDLAVVASNVDYGKLVDEFGASNFRVKLFRFGNDALNAWGMNKDYHGEQAWTALDIDRVPIWEIDRDWATQDVDYDAILEKYTDLTEQRAATRAYLEDNPVYAQERRRREALELGWLGKPNLINQYIDYYTLPEKGYWKERYLKDNQGLYLALKDADKIKVDYEFDKIPDVQHDLIYDKWVGLFTDYESVTGTAEAMAEARRRMLIANPEFARDRLKRIAYSKLLPNQHVDAYADYFTILFDGKPAFVETWYDDDWFLMEHKDFYNTMVSIGLWRDEPDKFAKVPTRETFKLWQIYLTLPKGSPRIGYRASNKDLDDWLVLTGKVSQSIPEKDKQAEVGKWGVWAEKYATYLNRIEALATKREKQAIEETESLKKRLEELMKQSE